MEKMKDKTKGQIKNKNQQRQKSQNKDIFKQVLREVLSMKFYRCLFTKLPSCSNNMFGTWAILSFGEVHCHLRHET